MFQPLLALATFAWLSAAFAAAETGIVWHFVGNWTYNGKDVRPYAPVEPEKLALRSGSGEIVVLFNGHYYHQRCPSPTQCAPAKTGSFEASGSGTLRVQSWMANALTSVSNRPALQLPMSRAAGWRDAVVAVGADGSLDLKEVLSAARPRPIAFKLCRAEGDSCLDHLSVEWNGEAAKLILPAGPLAGTYRLIAANGANECWVRLVPVADFSRVSRDYQQALETLRRWSWPAELKEVPGLDRLERLALSDAGGGQ